jgi:hypothetical protein
MTDTPRPRSAFAQNHVDHCRHGIVRAERSIDRLRIDIALHLLAGKSCELSQKSLAEWESILGYWQDRLAEALAIANSPPPP